MFHLPYRWCQCRCHCHWESGCDMWPALFQPVMHQLWWLSLCSLALFSLHHLVGVERSKLKLEYQLADINLFWKFREWRQNGRQFNRSVFHHERDFISDPHRQVSIYKQNEFHIWLTQTCIDVQKNDTQAITRLGEVISHQCQATR